ncbi:hypothetical protein L7F22_015190 [Adiantum nelumboides]|nr:hypothetical protein [Adiantum nelumboides]
MFSVYKILGRMITSRQRAFFSDLIHSTQAAFVQDRSILDNVVTFYEAVEWARQTEQPTTIMLLDFEKAYDRVDWGFLEGTLHRMGFPDAWIRGISALYRSASAAVTIGGHVGGVSLFREQGCLLQNVNPGASGGNGVPTWRGDEASAPRWMKWGRTTGGRVPHPAISKMHDWGAAEVVTPWYYEGSPCMDRTDTRKEPRGTAIAKSQIAMRSHIRTSAPPCCLAMALVGSWKRSLPLF